jgi:nucleoside-diphosphate-sugar epimerase
MIGEYGFLMNHIIDRLHREKCDIYTIAGKDSKDRAKQLPHHTVFEFSPDSTAVSYITQCVEPDKVIFMGAWNDAYDWKNDMTATRYIAELNNVLTWCKNNKVKQFLYLSTMNLYEDGNDQPIAEDIEPKVRDSANTAVYNGEKLCRLYDDQAMRVQILRLPVVYGPSHFVYEKMNPIEQMIFQAKRYGKIMAGKYSAYMTIYVSDAVDAVYKVLSGETCEHILYHIQGERLTTDRQITDIFKEQLGVDTVIAGEAPKKTALSLDGERFCQEFGYAPHISLEKGIARTIVFVKNHYKQLQQKYADEEERRRIEQENTRKQQMQLILQHTKNTFENLVLFVMLQFVASKLTNVSMFESIDVMLLYVLITSLTLGVGQSIFSVILATGGNIYLEIQKTNMPLNSVISNYATIFTFLFYFVFAIMISYTIFRKKQSLRDEKDKNVELQEEYEEMYELNKTNVEIKKVFEDRLLNYGDSIGKIYNIVSELDSLDPEKIVVESLSVVSKIMNVRDVCIYRAAKDGYFHFVDATTEDAHVMRNAIRLDDYEELSKAMKSGDIYINHGIGNELPRMAAPIQSDHQLIYMIMLWNMEFERLNNYQKNLFLVLAKIITSNLNKGYQYEEIGRNQNYYENTNILYPDIFKKMVVQQFENVEPEQRSYSLIRIPIGVLGIEEISNRLSTLVREDDKIGKLRDTDQNVYLLAHAGKKDIFFVLNKLQKNGFNCKVVEDA